ncbi:hypothetical protein EHS13_31330 [Paenibacillus psychroresistens]|uniref:F5/8 type C domain-containing protein n=1 Tax=Paenibacillus psychroresistens TaxID=1778678 RepID=A0A6B8RRM8_9BACL|nr:discoidin domain-containing protein [Paenibacillus psychroresistens]QGQ99051.1 hypothetical protein EHS13_31330 [Paenibacillus psychroresistens]
MLLRLKSNKYLIWFIIFSTVLISVNVMKPIVGFAATQATYYVNPSGGSDSNNGTSTGTAFATIAKARDVVRTINSSMTGDIIVNLMNGMHTLSSTLTLGTADSGTNGYKVIYQAYAGATPVISGGVDITTGWTLFDSGKNIYKKTGVNWSFRQLYVNDTRGVRARTPNLTDEITGAPYLSATNSSYPYTVNTADIGTWANSGTAEMVIVNHWSQYRGRISGYLGNTVSFKSPENGFAFNHHGQGSSAPYFFENAYELLDAAGEWFLDSANTTLYYKPRAGETMNTTSIVAPKLETLVDITGTSAGSKAHHIQFNGITFKHSNWLAPNSYGYVDNQAGFRYQTTGGGSNAEIRNTARYTAPVSMLQLKNTSNITLDHNTFKFAGSWGVMGYEATDNTSITWNSFTKNAGGAVALGIAGDQWDEQSSMDGQSINDTITNNTVDSTGLDYADMVGIGAMLPQNMTISKNEVKNLAYTGITIGWNWTDNEHGMTNNQIFGNHIHHVSKLLDDGGGIYTLGKMTGSTKFYQNYIHDLAGSAYNGGYPIAAIYFDNGSAYKTAEYNVLNNTSWTWFANNPPNHDNYFQNNYSNVYWGSYSGSNTFQNNTVVSGQSWPQAALDVMNGAGPGGTLPATPTPTPTPVPSIASSATFTASSEFSAAYAKTKAADGIIGVHDSGEWASAGETTPWITLTWSSSKTINNIKLYDRPNSTDTINAGTLSFSDGSAIAVGALDNAGAMKDVSFSNKTVTWVKFTVTSGAGTNVGLSEIQVYSGSGATPTPTPTPTPGPGLISQGKTATASSQYSSSYIPGYAVDGSNTTRWAQGFSLPDPSWLQVDLGANYNITSTNTMLEMPSGYKYKIEYAAAAAPTTWILYADRTASVSTQQSYTDTNAVTGRYVRVTVTYSSGYGGSIFEFKVYGT